MKPTLAKPTGPVQKKAGCSLCAMAGGSSPETAPAGYSCPLCSGKGGAAGPAPEAPRDSVQHKGARTADEAEAQADVLGAQIGAELGGAGTPTAKTVRRISTGCGCSIC